MFKGSNRGDCKIEAVFTMTNYMCNRRVKRDMTSAEMHYLADKTKEQLILKDNEIMQLTCTVVNLQQQCEQALRRHRQLLNDTFWLTFIIAGNNERFVGLGKHMDYNQAVWRVFSEETPLPSELIERVMYWLYKNNSKPTEAQIAYHKSLYPNNNFSY